MLDRLKAVALRIQVTVHQAIALHLEATARHLIHVQLNHHILVQVEHHFLNHMRLLRL